MENSKLTALLGSFSAREWRTFSDLVHSPYFNRNDASMRLCDWLEKQAPHLGALDKKDAFEAVFPGAKYNDPQFNHTMSALLKLGEQFVGMVAFQKEGFWPEYYMLKGFSERGLEKHYRYQFERSRNQMATSPKQGVQYHLAQYALESLEGNRRTQQESAGYNEFVQHTADSLDSFYMAEKLRYACFMLTSEKMLAVPYRIQLAEEVCGFIESHPLANQAPAVQAYYLIYQLLSKPEADTEYNAMRLALPEWEAGLGKAEMEEVYQYAINYCNLQIIQLRTQYVAEALALYIRGLESGYLLINGQLSPFHFKNIIKLALRLTRFEWTEEFIHAWAPLLPDDFREDAFHYNLAELYYYTRQNNKALEHLNRVEFTDVSYHLGAKLMLAKIYHETDAEDALDSLLHAFGIYLRRNKLISEDIRRSYLNFVSVLRKIRQSSVERYPEWRSKIESTALLAGKSWLLKCVE